MVGLSYPPAVIGVLKVIPIKRCWGGFCTKHQDNTVIFDLVRGS